MDATNVTQSVSEDSPNSADENMTNTLTAQDSSGSKNRSKRKPSKTQIKHITPKDGNCDISKYGTPNMEDLFNDDAHGIYKGKKSQMQASSSQPLTPSSVASRPTVISSTSKRVRKRPHAPGGPTSSLRRPTSRRPPNYSCGICGKMFFAPNRYNSHMQGHSRGKSFCCKTCGKFFSSQDKLNHHFPVHNTDRKASFTCRTCGKICVNWRAYLYHLKAKHTESGGKQFACNICGRQFLAGLRLRKHMARHATGKHHCCNICGKLFEAGKKLDIHVLVHNLTSKHGQNLQCPDCGRQYSKWIAFRQHMTRHEAEGVQYPCGECDMVFSTQYEKEKHKRVHKQVQCAFCAKLFRSASVLSVHLRVHTGERPYKCGLCERGFSQSSVLRVHMRIHRKEGKYECKVCASVYFDVIEYFRHHVAHLEEGNLQCEKCGKIFKNINNKNRHMAAHRNKAGRICQVCGKEFDRVTHLEAHMLCHSDQLPLLCKVCGKMFPSVEDLCAHYANHMKIEFSLNMALATSKFPFFCGVCGKLFKSQKFLNSHMKRHKEQGLDSSVADGILDADVDEVKGGKFTCTDCNKTFGHKHHLTVHLRKHTGEHTHTCILCGQTFVKRKLLLEHIGEHKRNGFRMYTGQEISPLKNRPDGSRAMKVSCQSIESGLETGIAPEENENVSLIKSTSCLASTYQQGQLPSSANSSHISCSGNSYFYSKNNSLSEENYAFTGNSSLCQKSYSCTTINSVSAGKTCEELHNNVYQEKLSASTVGTPFMEKNYTSPGSYLAQNYVAVSEKSYLGSSNSSFTEKNSLQSLNSFIGDERFFETSNSAFSDKNYSEGRRISYCSENRGAVTINHSQVSSADGWSHVSGVSGNPYNLPLSSYGTMSSDNSYLHSNNQSEAYPQQDFNIPHHDQVGHGIHLSMKEAGLQSSGPVYPHLTTSVQTSSGQDYRHDMTAHAYSYGKSIMSPGMNNSTSGSPFHAGFYNSSSRYPSELPVSNSHMLPQTAFPENSHLM